ALAAKNSFLLIAEVAPSTTILTVSTESDLKMQTPLVPSALGTTTDISVPVGRSSWPPQNASGLEISWMATTYMRFPFCLASAQRRGLLHPLTNGQRDRRRPRAVDVTHVDEPGALEQRAG